MLNIFPIELYPYQLRVFSAISSNLTAGFIALALGSNEPIIVIIGHLHLEIGQVLSVTRQLQILTGHLHIILPVRPIIGYIASNNHSKPF